MSNKLMKSLTIATAATAALVAQGVAADEVVATETQTSAIRTENTATNAVTAEQVAAAKQTADTANTAVTAQEAVVADANRAKQTTQEAENQASQNLATAQTVAQNVTPEAMAAADTAISQAEQAVQTAEETAKNAEHSVSSAQATVQEKQAQATTAQTVANQVKLEADSAKATVDNLKATDETELISKAQADVTKAQSDLASKEAAVISAKTDVETAKASDEKLTSDTKQAKTELDTAKAARVTAEENKRTAQEKVDNTQAAVTAAQADVDAVKPTDEIVQFNLKLNDELKDLMYRKFGTLSTEVTNDDLQLAIERFYAERDVTDSFLYDKIKTIFGYKLTVSEETVDLENLSDKQIKLYNTVFREATNALRRELGLEEAIVSDVAIDIAEERAKLYKEKAPSINGEIMHDFDIIARANEFVTEKFQKETGSTEKIETNRENLIYISVESNEIPLVEFLEQAIMDVFVYVFEDYSQGFGHTRVITGPSVLGVANYYYKHHRYGVVAALGFSNPSEDSDIVSDKYIRAGNIKTDSMNYERALEKLNNAINENNTAKANLATATANLAAAQSEVTKAQAKYDEFLETPKQTAPAQDKLAQAQDELTKTQETLAKAEQTLQALSADERSKAETIAKAEEAYEQAAQKANQLQANANQAQEEVGYAQSALHTATAALQKAQIDLAKAKSAVEEAKAHKASLVDAQSNLAKAQQALSDAKSARDVAVTKYAEEKSKLEELKAVYDIADSRYIELLNLYNLTQAAETPVNTKPTTPTASGETTPKPSPVNEGDATQPAEPSEVATEIEPVDLGLVKTDTEQPVSLKPILEQGHGLEAGPSLIPTKLDPATHQVTATPSGVMVKEDGQVTYSRVAKAQALPETGEATGALATVFGLVSLGLGLTAVKKRRKES